VAGVTTQLGSTIGAASLADGIYYRATLKANGTSLSAYMVRLSDNRVMDNTGAWQSLIQPCITATDAAVAGAGYAGIGTYVQPGSSATVRVDNAL
ncbi:hypothetical protein, partial [Glaesserella parasuis]|uniref:hypothetical protein n=1 Tax=Glaesserella parasuis TaxID=738 RepID=UPI003F32C9C2